MTRPDRIASTPRARRGSGRPPQGRSLCGPLAPRAENRLLQRVGHTPAPNVQRPTSNVEQAAIGRHNDVDVRHRHVRGWTLVVGRWTFAKRPGFTLVEMLLVIFV